MIDKIYIKAQYILENSPGWIQTVRLTRVTISGSQVNLFDFPGVWCFVWMSVLYELIPHLTRSEYSFSLENVLPSVHDWGFQHHMEVAYDFIHNVELTATDINSIICWGIWKKNARITWIYPDLCSLSKSERWTLYGVRRCSHKSGK